MSDKVQDKALVPIVSTPKKYLKPRKGKGFSLKEIQSASIPLDDAIKLSIPIDTRRKSVHDENVKVLSALYRDVVSTRSEEKVQLDLSKKEAFKELKSLRGIKSSEAKLMLEAGIKSLKSLTEEEPESLADDTKIRVEKIESWIEQAKTLIKRKGVTESIEELLQIKGMNKVYAKRLIDFGILSIEDLSQEQAEIVSKDLKLSEKIIDIWIQDARRLTGKPVTKKKPPTKKPKKEKPTKKPKEKPVSAPTLKDLEDIGKGDLKSFKDLGITKLEQLIEEDLEEVATITGILKTKLLSWASQARDLLGLPQQEKKPTKTEPEVSEELPTIQDPIAELLKLEGVGKKTAEKLAAAGIQSREDLINSDLKALSKTSKISEKTLVKIIAAIKNSPE